MKTTRQRANDETSASAKEAQIPTSVREDQSLLTSVATNQKECPGHRHLAGMSLVEMMVAMGLGSLVLASVISVSLYGTQSTMAILNFSDLDSKSRYALDVISREIRQATAVVAMDVSTNKSLTMTNASLGSSSKLTWNAAARTLTLECTGQAALTALTECDQWNFSLYQRTPLITPTNVVFYPATNSSGILDLTLCKLINMSWKCSRQIMAKKLNTESVQGAQIVLRNKQ